MSKERKIKRGVTVTNVAYKAFDGEKLVDRVVTFTGSIGDKACISRIKKTDSDAIVSTFKT